MARWPASFGPHFYAARGEHSSRSDLSERTEKSGKTDKMGMEIRAPAQPPFQSKMAKIPEKSASAAALHSYLTMILSENSVPTFPDHALWRAVGGHQAGLPDQGPGADLAQA